MGVCGPWYPDGWIEPEITWALVPKRHGHGFATEAAERAITVAYENFRTMPRSLWPNGGEQTETPAAHDWS